MPKFVHSSWFIVHRNKKTANYQFCEAKHILSATNFKVKHGFTLLEIVLSLFLILAIIVMLLSASGTYVSSRGSNLRGIAAKIESRQIETLRKMDFASLPPSGSFGDADLPKLPQGAAGQTLTNYQGSPDIKQVTIQVSWVESGVAKSISTDTLIYKNGLK